MSPEDFVRRLLSLSDPWAVPAEDAQDTLVSVIGMAKEVDFTEREERIVVISIPDRGLVKLEAPRIENGQVRFDVHVKKEPGTGPPLGTIAEAKPPPRRPPITLEAAERLPKDGVK
jgi:hypothetical protein